MTKNKYYLIRESLFESIIADAFTFSMIIGGAIINKYWVGDSVFFNVIFAVMFLMFLNAKVNSKIEVFRSSYDLVKHLVDECGGDND